MRGFERITKEEWTKAMPEELYDNITLPKRGTTKAAGYDFSIPYDIVIEPNTEAVIKTGIKAYMQENEVLLIYVRSSIGFKYNGRLKNQTGIIDSDYYNNSNNEGHIMVAIKNEGTKDIVLKKGDRFVQGIFMNYLIADNDDVSTTRNGGIGSTNK